MIRTNFARLCSSAIVGGAGIAHRCFHAADQLMNDLAHRALVRHLPLDALRHQLQMILDVLLEITVGRAARHCADRAHAAIGFVAPPLVEEGFTRRFFRASE